MKGAFVSLIVLIVLSGCSREQAPPNEATKPIDVSQIVIVETGERKERIKIESEVAATLATKDFNKLEELANQYRSSKSCYPNGFWKLNSFYSGLFLAKSDAEWNASLAALRDWVQTKPDSITARVALADALVTYGWRARGSGLADTVTENGWKLFRERLAEAVRVLRQADALNQKCPHSWGVLMKAAQGLGAKKSEYEAVFQKAIAFEPDCMDYYLNKANYLLPQWHGQKGDLAEFMQKSADKFSGEEGDVFYARLAWHAQSSGGNIFVEEGISWERTERGFQVIDKRFPDSLFVQNGRAYIAVMGCEKTLAPRQLVEALHGKIDTTAWSSKENFIRLTKPLYPR